MPQSLLVWSLQTSAVLNTEDLEVGNFPGPLNLIDLTIIGPANLSANHSLGLAVFPEIGHGTGLFGQGTNFWDEMIGGAILRSPLIGFSPLVLPICRAFPYAQNRVHFSLESAPIDSQPLSYALHLWYP